MFSKDIIDWYSVNGRELPWRNTRNPYLIWVSEIILQQTRVAQGYNYYMRFVERFPTVSDLAEAKEDEVLKYWEGLGYYSRARNLHAAAKSINGQFPTTYEDVLSLKGVGEYTAAAICSFAYDLPYAVLDGNVFRVLSRYYGISTPIDSTQGKKEFKQLVQELLDINRPALFNQAIMDFGALQCTPKQPLCQTCPLADSCIAYNNSLIDVLPYKQGKVKVADRYFNYFYFVDKEGNTYIHKRVLKDIWIGLYEFPLIETSEKSELAELLPKLEELTNGSFDDVKQLISDYKHVLSHQRIHTNIYKVYLTTGAQLDQSYLKISETEIDLYPFPRLLHQFIPVILE